MSEFCFLHAADIHLDSPLRGLSGHDESAAQRIREATRQALRRLCDAAIDAEVAFLIIAGDLYDGDWRDYKTGLFFAAQMGRLNEAGIDVYLLHGNHDAESQITRRLSLPDNVMVFAASSTSSFEREAPRVVLHGRSFATRDVSENLVPGYPAPVAGAFNIGVLHTGLGGLGGHQNYAPCTLEDLRSKGYDYWALGHVHSAQVLNERPHVVFPGNLQGRHARETGPKGAQLIRVVDGEIAGLEFIGCDVVRWAILDVAIDGAHTLEDVTDLVRSALTHAADPLRGEQLLAARVRLGGHTPLHADLLNAGEHLLADLRSAALGLGEGIAWVETLKLSTRPPSGNDAASDETAALDDLQQLLSRAADDDALRARLAQDLSVFARRLPPELATATDDEALRAALDGDAGAFVAAVAPVLLAQLARGED